MGGPGAAIHGMNASCMSAPQSTHVLLVTATDVETRCVLRAFDRAARPPWPGPATNVYWDLGVVGGATVVLVRSGQGSGGQGGAMGTVLDAITELDPTAVIAVGIALASPASSAAWE